MYGPVIIILMAGSIHLILPTIMPYFFLEALLFSPHLHQSCSFAAPRKVCTRMHLGAVELLPSPPRRQAADGCGEAGWTLYFNFTVYEVVNQVFLVCKANVWLW